MSKFSEASSFDSTRGALDCQWTFSRLPGKTVKVSASLKISCRSLSRRSTFPRILLSGSMGTIPRSYRHFCEPIHPEIFRNGPDVFDVNDSDVTVKFHQQSSGYPSYFLIKASVFNTIGGIVHWKHFFSSLFILHRRPKFPVHYRFIRIELLLQLGCPRSGSRGVALLKLCSKAAVKEVPSGLQMGRCFEC